MTDARKIAALVAYRLEQADEAGRGSAEPLEPGVPGDVLRLLALLAD